ncbi:hypothetical protein MPH_08989 [Macrophomina phaseolina MS6]|uniref:DUF7924 domain-containing protein n=1 Tax=Macrophomina phaseolina (strain MS6) TaxID=1126212 RepID=K2RM14_MACPH|nr:hypothetical protein MPH_08989 [Macrophomina phaseolina MS6]
MPRARWPRFRSGVLLIKAVCSVSTLFCPATTSSRSKIPCDLGSFEDTYHRHLIREFSFTEQRGKEKWTAYKFTKSIYEQWVPIHLARISSAIDQIPLDPDFSVGHSSEPLFSDHTGLSQVIETHRLSQSEDAASLEDTSGQLSSVENSDPAPDTSLSQGTKRRKRNHSKR